jgi:hypothetical protein
LLERRRTQEVAQEEPEAQKENRMKHKFPKQVFVNVAQNDSGPENLNAYRKLNGAVDAGGPTLVAEYRLVAVRRMSLVPTIEKELKAK